MTEPPPAPALALAPAQYRPRRTVNRGLLIAKVLAGVTFVLVITYGHGVLFRSETFGGFYDAQAKALLHGHWNVDPKVMSLEGFVIGGKTYEYFGPVPAILRMPWFAFTDRGFGRLSALSMIVAELVLLRYLGKLVLRSIRAAVDVDSLDAHRARFVSLSAGATLLALACGPPLFMASRPWAYHEASLWAMAFMLWGIELLLAWRAHPSVVVWLQLLAVITLCTLTRGPLGFGLVAAVAAVVALEYLVPVRLQTVRRLSRWLARPDGPPRWRMLGTCVVLVPLALYAAVNEVKFDSAFGLPIEAQVVSKFDPERIRALEANGGSLFSVGYAPTVLVEALRPDGVAPRSVFPFVGFPRRSVTIIGDPVFDKLDVSTSMPALLPGPTLLALLAAYAFARSRRWRRRLVVLAPVLAGAAVAGGGVLTIGFIANRYLMDLFPLLVVSALAGLAVMTSHLTPLPPPPPPPPPPSPAPPLPPPPRRTRRTRPVAIGAIVLAAWSMWTGTALALEYQRELSFGVADSERAAWARLQGEIGSIDGPIARRIDADAPLPRAVVRNQLLVVGNCEVVYRGDATLWRSVWASPAGGHVELRPDRDALERAGTDRLVVVDDDAGTQVALQRRGDQVVAQVRSADGTWTTGTGTAPLGRFRTGIVAVTVDPRIGFVGAWIDDIELLSIDTNVGRGPGLRVVNGVAVRPDRSLCRALGDG